MSVVSVAIGGFLGAILRYGTTKLFLRMGKSAPNATIVVNLLGSFFIGLASHAAWLNPNWQLFFITGFLGAYTTFSTFILEAVEMMEEGNKVQSLFYMGASLIGGIILFGIGWSI